MSILFFYLFAERLVIRALFFLFGGFFFGRGIGKFDTRFAFQQRFYKIVVPGAVDYDDGIFGVIVVEVESEFVRSLKEMNGIDALDFIFGFNQPELKNNLLLRHGVTGADEHCGNENGKQNTHEIENDILQPGVKRSEVARLQKSDEPPGGNAEAGGAEKERHGKDKYHLIGKLKGIMLVFGLIHIDSPFGR